MHSSYLVLVVLGDTYSMEGGLEAVVTPILQGIPNVDGDGTCYRVTWVPHARLHGFFGGSALACTHLQPNLT